MKIGFIGFGEAAYCISNGLKQEGLDGIVASDVLINDPVKGELIRKNAVEAGVMLLKSASDVVAYADVFFAAVPSSFTFNVCEEIKDALKPGQVYADISASTPAVKQRIWENVKDSGVLFADASALGSIFFLRHKIPLVVSGNGAQVLIDAMTPYGMQIRKVGELPGEASAIKLVRSIYMKGMSALAFEMLQAADAYNVVDQVVESITHSLQAHLFKDLLDDLIVSTAIHAKRRSAELKGSYEMLKECGLDGDLTLACKNRLEALLDYDFVEEYAVKRPDHYMRVIEAMRKHTV
jgi:3-hydroxyisobutyrate dehydrogenase-like beta-hydroxyacid dehydrogenase